MAYEAVSHLVGHGYKKIGLVTIPTRGSNAAERVAGYCRAIAENDLFNPDLMWEVDFFGQETFNLAVELLSTQQWELYSFRKPHNYNNEKRMNKLWNTVN